jgi:hypothetical protein
MDITIDLDDCIKHLAEKGLNEDDIAKFLLACDKTIKGKYCYKYKGDKDCNSQKISEDYYLDSNSFTKNVIFDYFGYEYTLNKMLEDYIIDAPIMALDYFDRFCKHVLNSKEFNTSYFSWERTDLPPLYPFVLDALKRQGRIKSYGLYFEDGTSVSYFSDLGEKDFYWIPEEFECHNYGDGLNKKIIEIMMNCTTHLLTWWDNERKCFVKKPSPEKNSNEQGDE